MAGRERADDGRLCLGIVTGAHGLRGLVRIRPFTDTPEGVAAYGPLESEDGARRFALTVMNRTGKGQVVARIDGVDDRNGAEALRGQRLYVGRDSLPAPDEDEYYHVDLIGLAAVDPAGAPLGTVRAVYDFGAGDILEIQGPDGRLSTVPFTRAAVPGVDLAAGRVVVAEGALIHPGNTPAGEGAATSGTDGDDG